MTTQSEQILKALDAGRSLTPLGALNEFGCFRLAARVKDLRDMGHAIKTERVSDGDKTYARYSIEC